MEKNKTTLYWVGENAYSVYKNSNEFVLNQFDHEVLLYSNTGNEINENSTYLDEFYPLFDTEYSVQGLIKSVAAFLKERGVAFQAGLFIGDASEVLVQTIVEVGTQLYISSDSKNNSSEKVPQELFLMAFKLQEKEVLETVNLMDCSFLFLKEAIPFLDSLKASEVSVLKAQKGFSRVLKVTQLIPELNDFLFHYSQEGIDLALHNSSVVRNQF